MANRMTEVTENDNVTSNDRILKESDRINKMVEKLLSGKKNPAEK